MENEKVVEINQNRIVLTNNDIMLLINQTPIKAAFDKIQNASSVSGKTQYWIYRTWKKIINIFKDYEEVRVQLAKSFCDKNKDGSPKLLDAQYQFEPEQKKLYEEEIKRASTLSNGSSSPISDIQVKEIAEKYCKKNEDGDPIKAGGNQLSFSKENMINFNKAFMELLNVENALPFDKIKINSTLLEQMNSKLEKIIDVNDMLMTEKIFDFIE